MKIIEADAVHASDIRYLNDSQEHQRAWLLVQEIVRELGGTDCHEVTRSMLDHIGEIPGEHLQFHGGAFVFSFSENSDLLSQWRGYGDDGRGLALGFSTAVPLVAVGGNTEPLPFHRVLYDRDEQVIALRPHVEEIIRVTNDRASNGDQTVRDAAVEALWTLAVLVGPTIKNPAFSEEREWRVVVSYLGTMAPLKLAKVRQGRAGLLPYCELKGHARSDTPSLPLRSMMLGPRVDGLQFGAMITYLATRGYEAMMPGLMCREDFPSTTQTISLKRSAASYR